MNCQQRETDLLMLVHGEAKGWVNLRTRLHILGCRRCRSKLAEFYVLSQGLANDLENPRLGSRRIIRPSLAGFAAAMVGLLVLLIAAGGLVTVWVRSTTVTPPCSSEPPSARRGPIAVNEASPVMPMVPKKKEVLAPSNFFRKTCD
ncbi:MAG: hypothetical protein GC165_09430 [Armatimonadetes bacterium]|nr:hypothetical protein [Armatimonadota bacterium]MBS1728651.1 hypothetical protein [Armatimonadota bacterium]